ncbi:1,4-alpha-glucan branching protein GlgB [Anaerococcus sp. Marseille-P3915]|uniref:1,4-alpha-glucan branching protein GlgB n=1 Tax=Anaerococcus sp. Marseille-P3915 TaxID=2057799 RepID=UPI000D0B11FB|nr:1,4-alpha-glucan branching protein GlgB [Anaerococcus sp. Marseille-P3915]
MKVNILSTDYDKIKDYIDGNSSIGHKIWGPIKKGDGYEFRVYAPNADKVYIKGDFTAWDIRELSKNAQYGYFFGYFDAKVNDYYKYVVVKDGNWVEKTDPFAHAMDGEGDFASKIVEDDYVFNDAEYLKTRDKRYDKPLNIYELHVSSFLRFTNQVNFLDIVDRLIAYIKEMNYTHVEIMPVTEYPFYPSWGYQSTGFFAISHRYGSVRDFKKFVDLLHQNNIGVILDVVAVHYASDYYGLDHFDGTAMYESEYMDLKYSEWGSNNFDYSKGHVRSFMKSSMTYLIEEFHLDGIRIDAVSYMVFYNGNSDRGVHEDNIFFIKNLNETLEKTHLDVMRIAEDSSNYPKVTHPVSEGGLGFDYKWDMGWMNDTLRYFKVDSYNRRDYQGNITFSMYYFPNERFLLPLSHDEVVHLKKSMVDKMAGSYEDKFKQLKVLMAYQMTHPGKFLNFMGNEIATFEEWNENVGIRWEYLDYPIHRDYHNFIKDLNKLYLDEKAFYKYDYEEEGFMWKVVDDNTNSVFAYERRADEDRFLVVLNMTGVYQGGYEIPYDEDLEFEEVLNSRSSKYGDYRYEQRKIEVKKGNNLKIELWEYEVAIFKIREV